jgi:hypothetical protein
MPAVDNDGKSIHLGLLMRIHLHSNVLVVKLELGTLEREALDCVHKLQETRDGIRELVEKPDVKLLEARGGDPMDKCFQVRSNTSELEMMKVRKCDGCRDWRMGELPFYVTIGDRK